MAQKPKRFYKVGEVVFVKEDKTFGVIKGLNIKPNEGENGVYKAVVEVTKDVDGGGKHITTKEVNLWEIDKDKRTLHSKSKPIGLNKTFSQVREFHKAFNHPISRKPTMLSKERAEVRVAWTVDEVQREFLEATDVVGQADAVIDGIYFLIGTLVEMGVKPERLFNVVQEANMSKLHSLNGQMVAVYREDGKIVKPEGWEAPEPKLEEEVKRQMGL